MKAEHYIKKVKESPDFKKLVKDDPKSYLCSLFFMRDFVEGKNETQVDFYSPKQNKIISFKADGKVEKAMDKKAETIKHKKFIPKLLKDKTKIDVDELKSTLEDEMHNRDMTYTIEKVLAFLTTADEGKPVWNCTGFLAGLGLLQAHVDDETNSVLFMDKKSFFDMIKFTGQGMGGGLPGALGAGMPQGIQASQPEVAQQPNAGKQPQIKILNQEEFAKMMKAAQKEADKSGKAGKAEKVEKTLKADKSEKTEKTEKKGKK